MIRFIDVMKDHIGVELVCHMIPAAEVGFVTTRGCRAAKRLLKRQGREIGRDQTGRIMASCRLRR